MLISGWQKTSLVDFPKKIATVIFTQGCNLNCFYCHNPELIEKNSINQLIEEDEILNFLKRRTKFIDGIVITGGEPTLQNDLEDLAKKIKNMGFAIKLDTNGTKPKVIKDLLEKKIVDYIAMDIKSHFENLSFVYNDRSVVEAIKDSIEIIKKANIEHEFRTTLAPGIDFEEITKIKDWILDKDNLVFQKCSINNTSINYKQLKSLGTNVTLRGFSKTN